jgi:hypothetical protein
MSNSSQNNNINSTEQNPSQETPKAPLQPSTTQKPIFCEVLECGRYFYNQQDLDVNIINLGTSHSS